MKKKLEYVAIWFVVKIIKILPLALARKFADLIAFVLFSVIGVRKEVTLENLRRAFPDWDFSKRKKTAKNCYYFYTRGAVEWLKSEAVLKKDKIDDQQLEKLDKFVDEGIILASGHIGYWELTGEVVAKRYGEIYGYADEQSNPYSQQLIDLERNKRRMFTYNGAAGVRRLAKVVKSGGICGVIADQRPRGRAVHVPFFDAEVKNTRIPAVLARTTGAPVIPIFAIRTGPDEISFFVEPPLKTSLRADNDWNEIDMLTEYNSVLEEYIRRYPEQYFWLHERWKGAHGGAVA